MENKIYKAGIGIFVIISAVLGYVILEADQVYYCEDTQLVGYCFKLSQINVDGFQTRCYYNESSPTRYKNCKTGWKVFTQGLIEPEIPIIYGLKQELCSYSDCVPIYLKPKGEL